MQNQELIEKLAEDTFWRAVRETIAGVFVLIMICVFSATRTNRQRKILRLSA